MRIGSAARLVQLQLVRDRRSWVSSTFGVTVGVTALCFFVALGLGITAVVRERIFPVDARLVEVVPSPLSVGLLGGTLDEATVGRLGALPGVGSVHRKMTVRVPAVTFYEGDFFGRPLRMGAEVLAVGVDPSLVRADVTMGDFADPGAEKPIPAVLASRLVELYNKGFAPARKLPHLSATMVTGFQFPIEWNRSYVTAASGRSTPGAAQVVGVSDRGLLAGITIPLEAARRINQAGGVDATNYSAAVLELASPEAVPATVAAVKEMGLGIEDSDRRMAEQVGAAVALTTTALGLLSVLICVLASFNIAHALSASVRARERELALMRAVGARRVDVFLLVVLEASVIGVLGGAFGVVGAASLGHLVDRWAPELLPPFPFQPDSFFLWPTWLLGLGFAVATLAALGGAVLPALRASRLDPARVLAGQGT